jgi:RNA polymerase sigma factor (sigma-70 family)
VSCTNPQPNENKDFADEIFEAYGGFIYKTICAQIKDESQANNLFQSFYLHLITYLRPRDLKNMKAFLYRSISRFILAFHRNQKKERELLHAYAKQKFNEKKDERPEKTLINAEEAAKMLTLIQNTLPKRESIAITERYKHGREISEVANILGVNVRSVSKYISSGLSKIQKIGSSR